MKWYYLLALLLVAAAVAEEEGSGEEPSNEELPLAEVCDAEKCKLPDCRCSGVDIPGGLAPRDVPQFVTVTFDDGINAINAITYRETLFGRKNSNGCPAGATFYVSHEYTDYTVVNELYNHGFEIALHSITHQTPQAYWAEATYETFVEEFVDQRKLMSHFANIPIDDIKGIRLPFLQLAGNLSYQVLADHGLLYDSSWPTTSHTDPAIWPYTLEYASTQDCLTNPPCPTASIPGVWVQPMVTWSDLMDRPCAMVDSCTTFPDRENEEEWFKFILKNFERHYMGNRAPFPFYIHEGFLTGWPAVRAAYVRFLNLINNLNDVFMVNAADVIDWVKNPVTVDVYRKQACPTRATRTCVPRNCQFTAEHNQLIYYPRFCSVCPRVYPWKGNPLGQ